MQKNKNKNWCYFGHGLIRVHENWGVTVKGREEEKGGRMEGGR